jgi:hypothetical protein
MDPAKVVAGDVQRDRRNVVPGKAEKKEEAAN